MADQIKSIRVRFLGKDYSLRVKEEDKAATIEMAEFLDERLRAFKSAHPEQSDLTAAVITALAVTEELFMERSENLNPGDWLNEQLDEMSKNLTAALQE
ncbi:MAG: cell division protein ZapA [Rhodothermales bacterium]|nr:cell division protein ZapA [Rhodothermales bacterium]